MIKKVLALSISLAFPVMSNIAIAEGNISEGQIKSENCASCHGEDGNSMASTFPKLAGQHANYLVKQLKAFKSNDRNGPMMGALAGGLDEEAMEDIAAYYASKKTSENQLPIMDDDDEDDDSEEAGEDKSAELDSLLALGNNLYRSGNHKSNVSACLACHGPSGKGNKQASFPALGGQHADYLIKSLNDYKNGSRSKDTDNIMHMIAKKMTDKEIKAVSYHISMKK